jgi:hypothetical protein
VGRPALRFSVGIEAMIADRQFVTLPEMRTLLRYLCLSTLIAYVLLTAASPGRAQDGDPRTETLRGLSGVGVGIEYLNDEAKRAGFDANTLQTDVELKLRLAGIKVLTREESIRVPGSPSLYVNLNFINAANGLGVYSIEVELKQNALLERDKTVLALRATTWSTGYLGTAPRDTVSPVRSALGDLVDRFLNAYLSVNPKK